MKTLTRLVRVAMLLLCASALAQNNSLLIQIQNGGSNIGTFKKYLVFNCGTNTSCSASGSTVTITASSTASTAFSGITASANSNLGTFSASGNTWDFSAAVALKVPVAVGAAPTADGLIAVNSTTHLPVFGSNGGTLIYPASFTAAAHNFVTGFTNTTGVFATAQPACGDLSNPAPSCSIDATNAANISSGILPAGRLPNPSATTLGGIESLVATSHLWINAISTSGVPSATQPSCGDLSNASGGCSMSTTAGGDLSGTLPSPTVAAINGNSVPSGAVADQILIGTAANTLGWKTLSNCTGGASAVSYATATHAPGCLANILTASLTSTRIPFSNGANSLTDSANLTFAAASGISEIQGANNADMFYAKRNTDTTPGGNFFHFQDAGALNDLFKVDVLGNVTASSYQTSNPSGNAGMVSLIQGTAPSAVANAINVLAPASVTTYTLTLPGSVGAGLWRNSSGGTVTFAELSGDCATSGSNLVTCTKVNSVAFPTTGASFDALPILTASNTIGYFQINGGANCGDATHALNYNQTTHLFGCQAITAAAPGAGGLNTQVQFNSGGGLAGSANLTWVSPVLTIGASGVTGQLSVAGSTSGATALQASPAASGTLTLPAATDTLIGKATTDTLTNKTFDTAGTGNSFKINGTAVSAVTGSGSAVLATSPTLITPNLGTPSAVTLTNATGLPDSALTTTIKTRSCEIVWGGTGTSNALQSGDDTIANNSCYNKTGVTETITAVYCKSDAASNTTTVNPTFGSAGTGTTILSAALTCGSSEAYSATGTVSSGSLTDGSGIDPVMGGTLTGHDIHLLVVYTLP